MAKFRHHKLDLTGAPRRVAACMHCGEVNDIAGHGACYRCYRRLQREKEKTQSDRHVDRHMGARQKRENKLVDGLGMTMKGLTQLGVSDADRMKVRVIVEPYLAIAKQLLGGPPSSLPPPAPLDGPIKDPPDEDIDDDDPPDDGEGD